MSEHTDSDLQAPSLSTYQDNSTFEYAKFETKEKIRNHLGPQKPVDGDDLVTKINDYYSIDKLVEFIRRENDDGKIYASITLQFPDSLICDSATIVHSLQKKLGLQAQQIDSVEKCDDKAGNSAEASCCGSKGSANPTVTASCCKSAPTSSSNVDKTQQKIWILADTSYSSCCVDEVAAEHVNSDLVIHFGDACLNPIEKLPVVYVFGKPYLDFENALTQFRETYQDKDAKILLMSDTTYITHLREMYSQLHKEYKNLAFSDIYVDTSNNSKTSIIGYEPFPVDESIHALNRQLIGVDSVEDLSEYDLFHITVPHAPRLLQLSTKFQSVNTFNVDEGKIDSGSHPNLMRRYRYVHMARSAGTIGLLVNTLSLANTKTLINKMAKRIKDAGKKHYIFVVGKPNVAKLANFENVDLWCILGCDHQGIIVDQQNEYFKPIVTPYELLLALSDELSWTGKWVTDFAEVLQDLENEGGEEVSEGESKDKDDDDDDYEDEAPEFNPVTGKYVSTSRPLRRLQHLQVTAGPEEDSDGDSENKETSLVKKFSSAVAIKDTVSTSAIHLQTRSWTGLGSDYKDDVGDEGAVLEDGRGGVARGYDFDIENRK